MKKYLLLNFVITIGFIAITNDIHGDEIQSEKLEYIELIYVGNGDSTPCEAQTDFHVHGTQIYRNSDRTDPIFDYVANGERRISCKDFTKNKNGDYVVKVEKILNKNDEFIIETFEGISCPGNCYTYHIWYAENATAICVSNNCSDYNQIPYVLTLKDGLPSGADISESHSRYALNLKGRRTFPFHLSKPWAPLNTDLLEIENFCGIVPDRFWHEVDGSQIIIFRNSCFTEFPSAIFHLKKGIKNISISGNFENIDSRLLSECLTSGNVSLYSYRHNFSFERSFYPCKEVKK